MDVSSKVRERILELLNENNLNTNQLAKRAGVWQSTVDSFIGVGRKTKTITLRTLLHICEGLKTTLKDFFDTEEFKEFGDSGIPRTTETKGTTSLLNATRQRVINLTVARKMKLKDITKNSKTIYSTLRSFLNGKTKTTTINTLYEICVGLRVDLAEFFDDSLFSGVIEEGERKERKVTASKVVNKGKK